MNRVKEIWRRTGNALVRDCFKGRLRGRGRSDCEAGGITVIAVGVLIALALLAGFSIQMANAYQRRAQAQTAADFAALAGAQQWQRELTAMQLEAVPLDSQVCEIAAQTAKRNGYDLEKCVRHGEAVTVELAPQRFFFGVITMTPRATAAPAQSRSNSQARVA